MDSATAVTHAQDATGRKKRILFVDDDPRILQGLRGMLRVYRRQWDMAFATDALMALSLIDNHQIDVVVTDMRMPGIDGAGLLERLRTRHPEIVRIVLSGHSTPNATARAVPVAHQFLSKPCPRSVLQATIERACRLQDLIADEEIKRAAGRVERLPSLPEIYTQLTTALACADTTAKTVARILSKDMGMCAKLLQLVNSAFFRLPRRITRIEEAVTYLGLQTVRSLVLSQGVFGDTETHIAVGGSVADLQKHALRVATLVRELAPPEHAEDAFLAGMLHDVGQLIVASNDADHGALGGYLLGLWGLPHPVVAAVAFHHDPLALAAPVRSLPGLVHVADALITGAEGREAQLNEKVLEELGLTDQYDRLVERAKALAAQEVLDA